jgi:hypothetical protein
LTNALWLVVGLGGIGVVIALMASWFRRTQTADLGTVSDQWIAEQRLGAASDRQAG